MKHKKAFIISVIILFIIAAIIKILAVRKSQYAIKLFVGRKNVRLRLKEALVIESLQNGKKFAISEQEEVFGFISGVYGTEFEFKPNDTQKFGNNTFLIPNNKVFDLSSNQSDL